MEIRIKDEGVDNVVNTSLKEVSLGHQTVHTPNRFLTSPEFSAKKRIKLEDPTETELMVIAKLIYPDTLTKILKEEEFFKRFVKRISPQKLGEEIKVLYLSFRSSAEVKEADHVRTMLDAQYLAGLDFITVQQDKGGSYEDFLNSVSYAGRWASERGVSTPIMPIIRPQKDVESASLLLSNLVDRGFKGVGVDLNGTFPYHTLKAVEEAQKKKSIWVHAFQVPPKIRFGGVKSNCALGMVLHLFGVDSFTRWIVPPPPEPLTMDKINVFDRVGWGYLKRRQLLDLRNGEMGCGCVICGGKDVNSFFQGKVLNALSKGKMHDHYSQRSELDTTRERIKRGELAEYLRSKEYPRTTLPKFGKFLR